MRPRPRRTRAASSFLEIDPLVDGQALQMTAQAVQPHLDGAQAYPLATADDAAAPRGDLRLGRDGQTDGAAELDPVRTVVDVDQDRQRMGGAGVTPGRASHGLRRVASELARDASGRQAHRRADVTEIARHDPAPEDRLRA